MSNTPLSFQQQKSLTPREVLISPRSGRHKVATKRLSAGINLLQQSPNLPEVAENEVELTRRRRHSRNPSAILQLCNNSSANVEELSETRPNARWSKDQLLQHYSQCMKLSQENKITHKNAFELQLIEHMGEMIRQDGTLNFRMAGGTIFAGAKIYASRVDAIHSEIYKVLNSLGSGDKDENPADEDNNEDPERKTRKRKKNSKILETNETTLRVSLINSFDPTDSTTRRRGTAIDAASCDSVMTNQLTLRHREDVLEHVTGMQMNNLSDQQELRGSDENSSLMQNIIKSCSDARNINKPSCDTFQEIDFDENAFDIKIPGLDSSDECSEVEGDPPADDVECTALPNDSFSGEADDCAFDEEPKISQTTEPISQTKLHEVNDALDVAQWVAIAPPAEYSYFKPSVLSVCNGPGHWLRHRSARTNTCISSNQSDTQSTDGSQPKKRKTVERSKKTTFDCGKLELTQRTQPQKMSKPKVESLRANVKNQLLLELGLDNESILRAIAVKVVLRHLDSDMIKKAGVTVSNEGDVPNFNYENDDYCPAALDSDYCDEGPEDNSQDLFSNTAGNFLPDYSQDSSGSTPTDLGNTLNGDYNAMLEGDHLVAHPRKLEKIQVHFAKRAKRIDVRKLKSAMWSMINPTSKETDVSVSVEDQHVSEQPLSNKNNSDDNEKKSLAEGDSEPSTSESLLKESLAFSEMYRNLPQNVSKTMWENMSVPLAFTCLLHLANEKQLTIEGTPALSDLKISTKQ